MIVYFITEKESDLQKELKKNLQVKENALQEKFEKKEGALKKDYEEKESNLEQEKHGLHLRQTALNEKVCRKP